MHLTAAVCPCPQLNWRHTSFPDGPRGWLRLVLRPVVVAYFCCGLSCCPWSRSITVPKCGASPPPPPPPPAGKPCLACRCWYSSLKRNMDYNVWRATLPPSRCTSKAVLFSSIGRQMIQLFGGINIAGDTLSGFRLSLSLPLSTCATSSSTKRGEETKSMIWWHPPVVRCCACTAFAVMARVFKSLTRLGPAMSSRSVVTWVWRGLSPCLIWSVLAASRMTAMWPFFIFSPSRSWAVRLSNPLSSSALTVTRGQL